MGTGIPPITTSPALVLVRLLHSTFYGGNKNQTQNLTVLLYVLYQLSLVLGMVTFGKVFSMSSITAETVF